MRHLGFSTATVPLTDGNKMRLHHYGCALNQVVGPLTVFHTHNYADNYSPEILRLQSSEHPGVGYIQNIVMPTLQQMHQKTAASPRSTAKLFLLLEELSYRHLYKVDCARLGKFLISSVNGWLSKEDDFASNGLRGLADFVTALSNDWRLRLAALHMATERSIAFQMGLQVFYSVWKKSSRR